MQEAAAIRSEGESSKTRNFTRRLATHSRNEIVRRDALARLRGGRRQGPSMRRFFEGANTSLRCLYPRDASAELMSLGQKKSRALNQGRATLSTRRRLLARRADAEHSTLTLSKLGTRVRQRRSERSRSTQGSYFRSNRQCISGVMVDAI